MAQRFNKRAGAKVDDAFAIAGAAGTPRGWFALSAAASTVIALAGHLS